MLSPRRRNQAKEMRETAFKALKGQGDSAYAAKDRKSPNLTLLPVAGKSALKG